MTILRGCIVSRQFSPTGGGQPIYCNSSSASWPIPAASPTGQQAGTAVLVCNDGGTEALIRFGTDATAHVGPNSAGVHHIPPGQAVLFDETEVASAGATYIGAMSIGGPTKLTILRGVTQKVLMFSSPADTANPTDQPNASGGALIYTTEVVTTVGTVSTSSLVIGTGTPS